MKARPPKSIIALLACAALPCFGQGSEEEEAEETAEQAAHLEELKEEFRDILQHCEEREAELAEEDAEAAAEGIEGDVGELLVKFRATDKEMLGVRKELAKKGLELEVGQIDGAVELLQKIEVLSLKWDLGVEPEFEVKLALAELTAEAEEHGASPEFKEALAKAAAAGKARVEASHKLLELQLQSMESHDEFEKQVDAAWEALESELEE